MGKRERSLLMHFTQFSDCLRCVQVPFWSICMCVQSNYICIALRFGKHYLTFGFQMGCIRMKIGFSIEFNNEMTNSIIVLLCDTAPSIVFDLCHIRSHFLLLTTLCFSFALFSSKPQAISSIPKWQSPMKFFNFPIYTKLMKLNTWHSTHLIKMLCFFLLITAKY